MAIAEAVAKALTDITMQGLDLALGFGQILVWIVIVCIFVYGLVKAVGGVLPKGSSKK